MSGVPKGSTPARPMIGNIVRYEGAAVTPPPRLPANRPIGAFVVAFALAPLGRSVPSEPFVADAGGFSALTPNGAENQTVALSELLNPTAPERAPKRAASFGEF